MRKYNVSAYKDFLEGTTERFSSATHNDLLGTADQLVIQWRATKVGGTNPKLVVVLYGSNNGVDWLTRETLVNAVSLTANTLNTAAADSSTRPMAFSRLGVALQGTTPSADVEVLVCGRDTAG